MVFGLALQVTHLGLRNTSILLSDVSDGMDYVNSFRKPGAVYIPANSTVTLVYASTVAMSFELGALRSFINQGELSASFVTGPAWAGVSNSVLVYRPGESAPSGNVFATWPALYAAHLAIQGQHTIEVDDSLVSPAVVPAGAYNMAGATLSGSLTNFSLTGSVTFMSLADGVTMTNLFEITDFLDVSSVSTSPVLTATSPGFTGFFVGRGSAVGASGGVPLIDVPTGEFFIFVLDLAGTLNTDTVSLVAGSTVAILGDGTAANVSGSAAVGPDGSLIFVIEEGALANIETAQGSFGGTTLGLLTVQPQSSLMFSAGSIPGGGASFLFPGGTNASGASPAAVGPQTIPLPGPGYIGVCQVIHQTPGAPSPITYDVLVNGIPVRSVSGDSSTFYSSTTSGNLIRVYSGDFVDIMATNVGVATPIDIRFTVGIA